jgi:hypothetical protein
MQREFEGTGRSALPPQTNFDGVVARVESSFLGLPSRSEVILWRMDKTSGVTVKLRRDVELALSPARCDGQLTRLLDQQDVGHLDDSQSRTSLEDLLVKWIRAVRLLRGEGSAVGKCHYSLTVLCGSSAKQPSRPVLDDHVNPAGRLGRLGLVLGGKDVE